MDEGLLSLISASCGQLVKMLITLEPHIIFDFVYIFEIGRGNEKRKEKNYKEKNLVTPGFEPLCVLLH